MFDLYYIYHTHDSLSFLMKTPKGSCHQELHSAFFACDVVVVHTLFLYEVSHKVHAL